MFFSSNQGVTLIWNKKIKMRLAVTEYIYSVTASLIFIFVSDKGNPLIAGKTFMKQVVTEYIYSVTTECILRFLL